MQAAWKSCLVIFIWLMCLATTHSDCPFGYVHFQRSCYYFSTQTLDWYKAEGSCRLHNSRLAEVDNKEQSDFLIAEAKKEAGNASFMGYWLGGRDDIVEGDWHWESSFKNFTYTAWAPGEPNSKIEDCLHLYSAANMMWNDVTCLETRNRYICEIPYNSNLVGQAVG